jgi:hypothetical protein
MGAKERRLAMVKFRVKYRYSKVIDFGEIEAKDSKEAKSIAEYRLWHHVLSLRAENDGLPYFTTRKVKLKKGN